MLKAEFVSRAEGNDLVATSECRKSLMRAKEQLNVRGIIISNAHRQAHQTNLDGFDESDVTEKNITQSNSRTWALGNDDLFDHLQLK